MSIYVPKDSFEAEKNKILKTAKAEAFQGMPKIASAFIKDQDPYPSSYLSMADYQIPKNMGDVFKWCRYFYKFDSLVGGAINALARFPVTDIILEDMMNLPENWDRNQDSDVLKLYKEIFEELKLEGFLISMGIDYWLYGNCFVFGEFKNISQDPEKPDYRWDKMFRLDPSKVIIDIDPLSQEKTFKWEVPAKIRKVVKEKKPKERFDAIPDVIKQAVKENKHVVLNKENVYHMSREGESGDGSVWGTPLVLNVMKQLSYRNTLRQAQEAIAREHIIPFRIYYLNPTEKMDPSANWSEVATNFATQLQNAARDPNFKIVSPMPVDVLNLGGQGRALMLTAEIDQLQAEILAGMGVPREFIFGGVSYSAASISLRVLENQFITFRLLLSDFLNNFVIRRMAEVRQEWLSPLDNGYLPKAKMSDLKMQDDIQQKQMLINLNASQKVSDEYLYSTLDIEKDKMNEQLSEEIFSRLERERQMQLYQMETQFMLQQTQLQYQVAIANMQKKMGMMPTGDSNIPPAPANAPTENKAAFDMTDLVGLEKMANTNELLPLSIQQSEILNRVAEKLSNFDEETQTEILSKVSETLRAYLENNIYKHSATSNPNTVSNSSGRNIALSQMSELERHQKLNETMQDTAEQAAQFNTDNAGKPIPILKPSSRSTLA